MTAPSPILLVLDLSALEVGKLREWQEFSRVGKCFIPQVVYDEIRFLCDRAPDANTEQIAREFMRFYPESGWSLTAISANHTSLKPASGDAFSKKARLSLAVAQAAYGLSRNHPNSLVVLVTTEQPLLQKVQSLGNANLCGITAAALRQWCRTDRPPIVVSQQLQKMQAVVSSAARSSATGATAVAVGASAGSSKAIAVKPRPTRTSTGRSRPGADYSGMISQLVATGLMLIALAGSGLVAWYFIQPASFNQFLQKNGLPTVPKIPQPAKS